MSHFNIDLILGKKALSYIRRAAERMYVTDVTGVQIIRMFLSTKAIMYNGGLWRATMDSLRIKDMSFIGNEFYGRAKYKHKKRIINGKSKRKKDCA